MKTIARFILRTLLGWKVENGFPQELKKYVVIAAPHTSWLDFPIAILARMTSGTMINFIGKNSLFNGPFGFFFRGLGGTPVDRSQSNNLVDAIIEIFNSKEEFRLGLSPEGTRKKVPAWKTGYYYIAVTAKVPIISVRLDYKNKVMGISEAFYPTGDITVDEPKLRAYYKGVIGKVPAWT